MKVLETLIDELKEERNIVQLVLNFKVSSGFIGAIPVWSSILSSFKTRAECEVEIRKEAQKQISTSETDFAEIDTKIEKELKAHLQICNREHTEALELFRSVLSEYRYTTDLNKGVLKKETLENALARELFDRLKSYLGQQFGKVKIESNKYVLIQKDESGDIKTPLDKNTILVYDVKNPEKIRAAIAGLIYTSKKYAYAQEHYSKFKATYNSKGKTYKATIIAAINEFAEFIEFPIDSATFRDMISQRYTFPDSVMQNFNEQFRTSRQGFNRTNKKKGTNREILSSRSK
jgi:hypothetical protein